MEIYDLLPKSDRIVIASPRGHGKAQSLDSKVLTPDGWKKIGDLQVGSLVIGSDGYPTKITHIHPIEEMDLYKIQTRDGRETLCNLEHLWKVTCPQNFIKEKVLPLKRIFQNYKTQRTDKRTGEDYTEYRYFLDWAKPVYHPELKLPLDPYTLGVWLGDGTSENGNVTSNDPEIFEYLPYSFIKCKAKYRYLVKHIRPVLRKLGVLNNKHIPEAYLFSSIEQRTALLQGLNDTDGFAQPDGLRFDFTNKNKNIIDGYIYLVRSLGGTATLGEQFPICNGKKCHAWRVTARLPKGIIPFRLKRKADIWRGSIKTKSAITNIEFNKRGKGRCITVGNPDGLYITDDFLLTHNSTICSVFYPIWLALFQKRKDITIISASESLAIEWLRKIKREFETNKKIIAFFGDLKSDKWTENHIIVNNDSRVNIRARGAGSQIRGFRPDCLVMDDLETNESVESEEQRKKLKDWIFKDCLNTLLPGGQFIVIGTIIHPLSVLADLLVADNGWIHKKYQAYIDGEQKEGKELWGALWNHQKLQERKREIGSWAFAAEYMNDPVSDETAPIKEAQIRYWTEFPKTFSSVLAVDPAYSDDEKSDYKTCSHIAIDQHSNRYLASYIRTHAPIGEFQDAIINLWLQNRNTVTSIGIPNQGVEKSFFDSFLKKCDERKLYPPVVELKNAFTQTGTSISLRGKKARCTAALQPLFEQGKYFIHPDHIEARDELLSIGSSRWDDLVDTLAYAEQILQPYFEPKEQIVDRYGSLIETPTVKDYGF